MNSNKRNLFSSPRILFISTYPPRRCGIATFTFDLVKEISKLCKEDSPGHSKSIRIIAVNEPGEDYHYGQEVIFGINSRKEEGYGKTANFLNNSEIEVVCLQHEFGIFGGKNGTYILSLLKNLRKPVVTTLHSVGGTSDERSKKRCDILRRVCQQSTFVVAISQKSVQLLDKIYENSPKKIVMIRHGAPNVPFLDPAEHKASIQARGRPVILTFGLLSPNKGIEIAIEAMSLVVRKIHRSLYIILGITHPNVVRRSGEKYRDFLKSLVAKRKLEKNVIFHNEFVDVGKLHLYLAAADIYLTPYRSKEQISSGTLTQALAYGKAIVSTPYPYAEELLSEGRGCLIPFVNPRAMAAKIVYLLENENERDHLRKRAYQFGRNFIWPEIARQYLTLFTRTLGSRC